MDHGMSVLYHSGETNVIADALCFIMIGRVSHVEEGNKDLVKDVHTLAWLVVWLENSPNGGFVVHRKSKSSLVVEEKYKQDFDPLFMELKDSIFGKFNDSLSLGGWRT